MNCSTPGLPVHHQLPEFTQTHVHRVSDAIQPSHPLSSPSPPPLNLSQHQSLFKWVSSLHQVAQVLELQLQHQSLQWTLRTDLLYNPFLNLGFSVVKNLEPCYLKCCLLLKFDKWWWLQFLFCLEILLRNNFLNDTNTFSCILEKRLVYIGYNEMYWQCYCYWTNFCILGYYFLLRIQSSLLTKLKWNRMFPYELSSHWNKYPV